MKRLIGRAVYARELAGIFTPRISKGWLAGSWLAVLCALGTTALAQDSDDKRSEPTQGTQSASRAAVGLDPRTELLSVVEPKVEMDQTSVSPLGDDFSPATGTITFSATDISIPGNFAIPVELRRWVPSEDFNTGGPEGWKWNIPFIRGNFLDVRKDQSDAGYDWGTGANWRSGRNCDSTAESATYNVTFDAGTFWQGKLLHIPGVTSESFLTAGDGFDQQVTKSNFRIVKCTNDTVHTSVNVPPFARDVAQQGIIVLGPDGTRYTFNQVKTYFNGKNTYKAPLIYTRLLMITRIEDRFKNYVNYEYQNGNLVAIKSSDGREITITYQNGVAVEASAQGRTWRYGNGTVELPDGRQWTYSGLAALAFHPNGIADYNNLYIDNPPRYELPWCGYNENAASYPVTITSPDGLQTTYTFRNIVHYRSEVEPDRHDTADGAMARILDCTVKRSLISKTSTGAGVGPYTWTYAYSGNRGTYTAASQIPRNGEPGSFALPSPEGGYPAFATYNNEPVNYENYRSVTVTGPDKRTVFYIDRRYQSITEDRVVAQDTLGLKDGQWRLLERAVSSFALGANVGQNTMYSGGINGYQLDNHINQTKEHKTRYIWNGSAYTVDATFTTEYPAADFDTRGRPKTIKRSGSASSTPRTERIVYEDKQLANDTTHGFEVWVLGLVKKTSVDGIVQPMEEHEYHPNSALRISSKKFGVLQANYDYHSDGNLWKVTDGLNHVTIYTNYYRGKPQHIKRANDTSESATVNAWGLITGRVDPNNHAWSYDYDGALRLKLIKPPLGWNQTDISYERAASQEYDLPAGHWRQTVSKDNAKTVTYFDVLWRPVMVRTFDAANEAATRKVVVKTYDVAGQVVFESYPRGDFDSVAITTPGRRMQFDALGRATQLEADIDTGPTYKATTTTEYLSGFRTKVTNPRGKVTTQTMWAQDDPAKAQLASISAPEGVSVVITRNVLGNPTSIRRSGDGAGFPVDVTRSYVYDSAERLCKTLEPEVVATAQGYDAAGNIAWRAPGVNLPTPSCAAESSVPAAKKIAYTYDAVNQLTGVSYGDGSPGVTRTYWNDGLLKTISSNGSVWTYDYNSLRKPTTENLAFGGKTYNFAWAYDANGSLSQLTYPTGGPTINYAPNALGEPGQVSGYASNIAFHPNGAVSGFTFGNNIVHSLTQTVEGTPKQNADGTILQDLYAYDANGNVSSITDQRASPSDGAFSRTMSYDDLDRLAGVSAPTVWGSASYVYDSVDNLRSASVGSRVTTLNYDATATRLSSVVNSGVSAIYAYDGNGNISQKGSQTFTFDLANRIAASSLGGSFAYDGHGRRTKIVRNDGSTHIQVYSQGGQLLWSEKNVAGTYPATQGYSCATGTLVGQQCVTTTTYTASQGLVCNQGDTLSGSTCTHSTSYAATPTYSCPSGGTLNGTTCTRSSSYAATPSYSCNSGDTRSGSTCYSTSSYTAVTSYSCPSGGSLNGTTCNRNDNYSASVDYVCNSGDTRSGTTCTRTTYVSANIDYQCNFGDELRYRTCFAPTSTPATASYNCNGLISDNAGNCTGAGGMAYSQWEAQDMCYAQESTYGLVLTSVVNTRGRWYDCIFQARVVYACPGGGTLYNGQCLSTTSYAATPVYSCGSGAPVGNQCPVTQTYAATPNYTCPNGGSLSNGTCIKTTSYAATASSSCPYGGTPSGNSCVTTSTYAASSTYTCPSGGSLSGTTCNTSTTTNATATYGCPNGGTPNGSSCIQTSTYAATYGFVCNAGDTLNNGTCTRTTTTAATSGYTCPDGGTLSNNQCVGGSVATKTAYVYLDGKQIAETVVGGATQYVHTDALGSPVARTDKDRNVLNRTKFEPYGYTAAGTKPGPTVSGLTTTGSNIGFTGHVNDPETDLVYMQQRYYDPIAGRFLSVDPITTDVATGKSFNRYHYGENNPYKYVDRDGRQAVAVLVPPIVIGGLHYVLPGRKEREASLYNAYRSIVNGIKSEPKRNEPKSEGGKSGPKPPKETEPITNPPQAPVIPPDWESKPGRTGGEVFYPPGTNPADGEHIRVMPPGSSPVPGYEDGYWKWINGHKQPIDPSTGKPGKGQGDTHVPLPPDSFPPPRR
jgi:RHS repeat-associated protein